MEVGGRERAIAKEKPQQLSAESLYKAGRDFIDEKLASVIVVGPDEKIVPLRTDYRVEGGMNLGTGETTRSVVANRVVFWPHDTRRAGCRRRFPHRLDLRRRRLPRIVSV